MHCEAWEPVGKCFDSCFIECIDFHGLSQIIASLTRDNLAEREAENGNLPWTQTEKDNALAKCGLGLPAWRAEKPMLGHALERRRWIRQKAMWILGYGFPQARAEGPRHHRHVPDDVRCVIVKNDFDEIMASMKESAPGPDGTALTKGAGRLVSLILFCVYRTCAGGWYCSCAFLSKEIIPNSSDCDDNGMIVPSPEALRPLTLCNCDCKILTTIICRGLHWCTMKCVHLSQRGFSSRQMTDNICEIGTAALTHVACAPRKSTILLTDFPATCYGVSRNWIFCVVDRTELPEFICRFLQRENNDSTTHVKFAGTTQGQFLMTKGVRHGCSASGFLFTRLSTQGLDGSGCDHSKEPWWFGFSAARSARVCWPHGASLVLSGLHDGAGTCLPHRAGLNLNHPKCFCVQYGSEGRESLLYWLVRHLSEFSRDAGCQICQITRAPWLEQMATVTVGQHTGKIHPERSENQCLYQEPGRAIVRHEDLCCVFFQLYRFHMRTWQSCSHSWGPCPSVYYCRTIQCYSHQLAKRWFGVWSWSWTVGIHPISLAARHRIAACSNTLNQGLEKIQAARTYDFARVLALSVSGERTFLLPPCLVALRMLSTVNVVWTKMANLMRPHKTRSRKLPQAYSVTYCTDKILLDQSPYGLPKCWDRSAVIELRTSCFHMKLASHPGHAVGTKISHWKKNKCVVLDVRMNPTLSPTTTNSLFWWRVDRLLLVWDLGWKKQSVEHGVLENQFFHSNCDRWLLYPRLTRLTWLNFFFVEYYSTFQNPMKKNRVKLWWQKMFLNWKKTCTI